jgi:hypothetical protein
VRTAAEVSYEQSGQNNWCLTKILEFGISQTSMMPFQPSHQEISIDVALRKEYVGGGLWITAMLSEDGKWVYDETLEDWVPNEPGFQANYAAAEAQFISSKNPAMIDLPGVKNMNKRNLNNKIYSAGIAMIMALGFLMMIMSEQYTYSSNHTPAPEAPDTVQTSDFDGDENGNLNTTEQEAYQAAVERYNQKYQNYLDDLEDHNFLMLAYEGKATVWSNIAPGFIVAGLVCLTFQSKGVEMTNSIRLTLLIGTMYMVANLLGYNMPGVAGDVSFGFGE